MTKHIGIVAGSAEGAALCYRTICLEAQAVLALSTGPLRPKAADSAISTPAAMPIAAACGRRDGSS